MTALILYFFLALGVSFLCSLLEAVLLSVRRPFVVMLKQEGRRAGHHWERLKSRLNHPLAAILSLNTIANTLGAAGVGAQVSKLTDGEGSMLALASGVLTLSILVVSEIIPKTIGATYWKAIAPPCAYVILALIYLMYPFVLLLELISRGLASKRSPQVSREELTVLADLGEAEGTLDRREAQVIRNLMRLDLISVEEIMTPRAVVAAFPKDKTVGEVVAEHPRLRFSRIPIYGESLDDIVGIVLRHRITEEEAAGRSHRTLSEIARPVHAVPHSKKVGRLLEEFVARNEHVFLVVDEYGGTEGIVTFEDYIETLLSVEIVDELDPAVDMRKLAREKYRARRRELEL
jgi:CBS domain containing-hemolysin-like protein